MPPVQTHQDIFLTTTESETIDNTLQQIFIPNHHDDLSLNNFQIASTSSAGPSSKIIIINNNPADFQPHSFLVQHSAPGTNFPTIPTGSNSSSVQQNPTLKFDVYADIATWYITYLMSHQEKHGALMNYFGMEAVSQMEEKVLIPFFIRKKFTSLVMKSKTMMLIFPFYFYFKQGTFSYLHPCKVVIEAGAKIPWSKIEGYYRMLSKRNCSATTPVVMLLVQFHEVSSDSWEEVKSELPSSHRLTVQVSFPTNTSLIPKKLNRYLSQCTAEQMFEHPATPPSGKPFDLLDANTNKKPEASDEGETSVASKKQKQVTRCPIVEEVQDEEQKIILNMQGVPGPQGTNTFAFEEYVMTADESKVAWMFDKKPKLLHATLSSNSLRLSNYAKVTVSIVIYDNGVIKLLVGQRFNNKCELKLQEMPSTKVKGLIFNIQGIAVARFEGVESQESQAEVIDLTELPSESDKGLDWPPSTSTEDLLGHGFSDLELFSFSPVESPSISNDIVSTCLYFENLNLVKQRLSKDPSCLFAEHPSGMTKLDIIKAAIQENLAGSDKTKSEHYTITIEEPYLSKMRIVVLFGALIGRLEQLLNPPSILHSLKSMLEEEEDNTHTMVAAVLKEDKNGETLLHQAISSNWVLVVEALLEFDFDLTATNRLRQNYLAYCIHKQPGVYELLRQKALQNGNENLVQETDTLLVSARLAPPPSAPPAKPASTSVLLENLTKKCPVVVKDDRELKLHRYADPMMFSGSLCFAFTEGRRQVVYEEIGWMLTNTEIPTTFCKDCWVHLKGKEDSVVSLVLYSEGSLSIQLERRTAKNCQLYVGEKGWYHGIVFDLTGKAFAYIEPAIDLEDLEDMAILSVAAGGGYESTDLWQNQLATTTTECQLKEH